MSTLTKTTALIAIAGMLTTPLAMAEQHGVETVDGTVVGSEAELSTTQLSALEQLAAATGMSTTALITTGVVIITAAGAIVISNNGSTSSGT
jgi:hypothetical protein